MDWDAFSRKYEEAAIELSKDPHYDIKLMEQINKVLTTLGRDPYPINSKIESYQLDLFQVS